MKKIILNLILLSILYSCTQTNNQNEDLLYSSKLDSQLTINKIIEDDSLPKDSISYYKKIVENDSSRIEAIIKLSEAYNSIGNYEQTILLINSVISKIQDSDLYGLRGYAKEHLNLLNEALTDYNRSLELNPNSSKQLNNRGYLHYKLKNFKIAISDIEKAIQIDPQLYVAYSNRGLIKSAEKKYSEAIIDFNKAIELKPLDIFYFNRGISYYYLGKYKESVADFSESINLNPLESKYYLNRAFSKYKLKDYDGACFDWKKATEMGNEEAREYYDKGCVNKGPTI